MNTATCTTTTDADGGTYGECDDGTSWGQSACGPLPGMAACPDVPAVGADSGPVMAGGSLVLVLGVAATFLAHRRRQSAQP